MSTAYLSDLLYCDLCLQKHAALKKGLLKYRFLLHVASSATKHLRNLEIEKFDALVGENACQIRAIKIATLASGDLSYLKTLTESITSVLIRVDTILLPSSINPLMHAGKSLQDVIDEHNLHISLSNDEIFFIQCFVLSEMKILVNDQSLLRSSKLVPIKIQSIAPEVSGEFLKFLSSKFRQKVSQTSVNFVQKLAVNSPYLSYILSNCVMEHAAKSCAPMFWTYKVLLMFAMEQEIPIILHVKFWTLLNRSMEKVIYFKPCLSTGKYVKEKPTHQDLLRPACIIQGLSCIQFPVDNIDDYWDKIIQNTSLEDMILAGAADHRQYPDPNLHVPIEDLEYEKYKKMAREEGFSLSNPSKFFIQHVYSALVKSKFICQ